MARERERPFDLLRYFTGASLVVILIVSLAAGAVSASLVRAGFQYIEREEAENLVANLVAEMRESAYAPERWAAAPLPQAIAKRVLADMETLGIDEMKLIDADGRETASLVLPDVSESPRWRAGFEEARAGRVGVRLEGDRGIVSLIFSQDATAHIDSYVPVREAGKIVAVVKVRRDVAPMFIAAQRTLPMIVALSGLAGLAIFGVLWILVRRADRIIKEQHAALAAAREALEEHNRRLAEIMRQKEEFYAACSHDLRTPLLSVHAGTRLLLGNGANRLDAEERRILEDSARAVQGLLDLIGNLLDLARSEARAEAVETEPVDLAKVLEAVVATYRALAGTRGVAIETVLPDASVRIVGDRAKLVRVFGNLVSNAIKHAPGSPVTVSLDRTNGGARVVVSDRGPGIPPDRTEAIFGRFETGAGPAAVDGHGLGLAIVRELVEAHGGTISVESVVGEGTSFRVHLPATPSGGARGTSRSAGSGT